MQRLHKSKHTSQRLLRAGRTSHYDQYKDYSLTTFRALEAKNMKKRSIIP